MSGTAVSVYGDMSLGFAGRGVMTVSLLCVCVSDMLLERTVWYACSSSPNSAE